MTPRDELLARMKALQLEIIEELGGLDLRVYRQRLEENGLLAEWESQKTESEKELENEYKRSISKHRR